MRRTDFLEQKSLDGHVASRKLARNGKNLININKPFPKGPFSLSCGKKNLIFVLLDKYYKTRTNMKYGKISEKSFFTGLIIARIA